MAFAAFAFAVHQFVLKYLYDQSSYTRTPGGVLLISLGFAGICLPIVLLRNRQRFSSLRPSRQWLLAVGLPPVYVLMLALCLEASHRSRTIILPRPFTPTAIVHYRPGNSRVEFRGDWRLSVGGAYNDAEVLPDGSEEFSSYLAERFIRDALEGPELVAIIGRATPENHGSVQILLEVHAKEAIRFAVENLDDVRIMRDGRPLVGSQSQSGTFHVIITGRQKKNT
ncbi:MAG: hypothetical protein AB7O38_18810 [Pirellulaceae bacterium]